MLPIHMNLNDFNKVLVIKTLRRFRESEAREILEDVAKQVQPIMRKRNWKVHVLSEFSPGNPSLLGLNIESGAEVKLRLRRSDNELEFLPFNQILDTMLHELCHNEYGPHNTQFYNLLDEIRKECEELMARGISGTGQGFDLPGRRLGGFAHPPPLSSLWQDALVAAQNRALREAFLPSGPERMGGDSSIMSALSPIQAAAMAADRRLHDEVWCEPKSSESEGPSERFKDSALPEDKSNQTSHEGSIRSPETTDVCSMWQCITCTLLNQQLAVVCEACGTQKNGVPGTKPEFWSCKSCTLYNSGEACEACGTQKNGHPGTKPKVWSCKFCTLNNTVGVDRCTACGEWRYSYGPPASASGPSFGT